MTAHAAARGQEERARYWKEQLEDAPPRARLHGDLRPPAGEPLRAALCRVEAPAWLRGAVEAAGREAGGDALTFCAAAAAAWLYRLTLREHQLVGVVDGGEALPLRLRVRGDEPFSALLEQARRAHEGARAHRLSLEEISRAAGDGDGARELSFGAVVGWDAEPRTGGGCELALGVGAAGRATRLSLAYDAARLSAAAASRSLEYFRVLLDGALADPAGRVATLPLATQLERGQLLLDWQGSALLYPHEKTFHQLYEEQADRTPEAVAAVFGEEQLTYAQLDAQANAVAHLLLSRGVGPETRVGVYMDNSLELAVAVLGVFKAGAVYVPLATAHPRKHRQYIISDTGLSLALAQRQRQEELSGDGVQVIALPFPPGERERRDRPDGRVGGGNLCAVLYTSGSTGTPKGVELSHQALMSRVFWMQSVSRLNATDRHILLAPMHIARFVGQLFWPWLTGGCMVITRPDGDKDNVYLLDLIRHQRVSQMHLGPTTARILMLRAEDLRQCTSLRNVFVSGEAFPADLQDKFRQEVPTATLHKAYGLAETNFVTYCQYQDPKQTPTVGRPNYMKVYLLDAALRPVPIGVPGEICSSGIGLARGFANKPDLVAARFVPDPFSDRPGERMYRTGDLGRWLADGNIEFLGRIDHQVKVRGYPVDLGEIEATLAQHPDLGAAVVIMKPSAAGDARLIAYGVPRSKERVPAASELRRFMSERLPSYMVPSAFVTLEQIPLRSGKIDRHGLPEPAQLRPLPEETYVAPQKGVEEQLARIFEDVLELKPVGSEDDFFELGGHSLLGVRAVSRIAGELEVDLRFDELFLHPTVRKLAELIQQKGSRRMPPIRPVPLQPTHPLSPMQESFYALEQVERSAAYNCKSCLVVEGALDRVALAAAFQDVLARHEALRATFVWEEGEPRQRFQPQVPFSIEEADFTSAGERSEQVQAYLREQVSRPFDLGGPCLLRAALVKLRPDQHLILLVAPHIMSDGWSLQVALRDLLHCYSARAAGTSPGLQPLPLQYKDFVAWYRDLLGTEEVAADQRYWFDRFSGKLPVLDLPLDFPRPPLKTNRGRSAFFTMEPSTVEALKLLSQGAGVTPFMTLVAAVKVLLSGYSGQDDVIVGTPIAGRILESLENQVGNYINVVALRDRVNAGETFRAFLAEVKKTVLGAHAHQLYPFDNLTHELDAPIDLSRNVIFDVLVAYHNYRHVFRREGLPEGLAVRPMPVEAGTSRFDLAFDFYEYEKETVLELEYAVELFRPERVQKVFTDLSRLLVAAGSNPEAGIGQLHRLLEVR